MTPLVALTQNYKYRYRLQATVHEHAFVPVQVLLHMYVFKREKQVGAYVASGYRTNLSKNYFFSR